ncbi:hypothetical protein [Pseudomonas kurunegalensis]|uniref:hypothetical protein n=1 Tax=Pseudomonas kurunegalensis TaxID=485880 RepID=UPI0025708AD2|nr:hypothetical protein [Pseudomonas kurunegalensis]WJD64370.1 hypothetical protein QQ992_08785 [Pseudomonas kurunegalensis]
MPTKTHVQTRPVELSKPVKLSEAHDFAGFDCGERSINEYLHKRARKAQQEKLAVVYVTCFKGTQQVAGFYTLSSGSIARQSVLPRKLQRNTPFAHPATILGRMGVTLEAQGYGFAEGLLQDAILRVMASTEVVASSAILVHPLNETLADFYASKAGFVRCPDLSPLTMMLSLR